MISVLYVFLGSGIGGVLRWWLSSLMNGPYPWGTLTVNVVGCLLIGLLNGWLNRYSIGNEHVRLLLVAGFCGGFTTFSTFINENFMMLRGQEMLHSVLYLLGSIALSFMAVWWGYHLVK